jgi:hypothetical protein
MIGQVYGLAVSCSFCSKQGPLLAYDYNKYQVNGMKNAYAKRMQLLAEQEAVNTEGFTILKNKNKVNMHICSDCKSSFGKVFTKTEMPKVKEERVI